MKGVTPAFPERSSSAIVAGGERAATVGRRLESGRSGISSAARGESARPTCAAARAVQAARTRRTLLVSTDPASSLGDVLGVTVSSSPRPVLRAGRLSAANLDAAGAFSAWLSPRRDLLSAIALRGTYLDDEDVGRLLQLSLPGLDEIVGLLAVVRMAATTSCDTVIVDSAPTGHTLRLLDAPDLLTGAARLFDRLQAHHREVVSAVRGRYTADAADQLILELEEEGLALLRMLRDRTVTRMSWVTDAEPMALEETADAIAALSGRGMRPDALIVNRLAASRTMCRWCDARRAVRGTGARAARAPAAGSRLVRVAGVRR